MFTHAAYVLRIENWRHGDGLTLVVVEEEGAKRQIRRRERGKNGLGGHSFSCYTTLL